MKRNFALMALFAALVLAGCRNVLNEGHPESEPVAVQTADPVGGLTIRVVTGTAYSGRAITGVTKMVINLESAEFPSLSATATENAGVFTAQIASVKPGEWTVKASLFDANDVEKYFGQTETVILSGIANSVNLAVAATGSVGVDVTEDPSGPRAAAPVISPGVTNMMETFYATLTSSTPGAAIRYTLDGSEPTATHGLLYTGPIFVYSDISIRAIALKDGLVESRTTTQSYDLTIPEYTIGSTGPAGGLIFYDAGNYSGGWRYLEAAPSDQSSSANWSSAVDICDKLVIGAYSDWYLPSRVELDYIYDNLKVAGLGNFSSSYYWSSTTYMNSGTTSAWVQAFDYGSQVSGDTNFKHYVRAIRAF